MTNKKENNKKKSQGWRIFGWWIEVSPTWDTLATVMVLHSESWIVKEIGNLRDYFLLNRYNHEGNKNK